MKNNKKIYRTIISLAILHYFFILILQVENITYLYSSDEWFSFSVFFTKLMFIQWEHLLVSIAIASLFLLCHHCKAMRWIYLLVILCFYLFLVCDQLIYKISFQHMQPAEADVNILNWQIGQKLLFSAWQEVDIITYCNLLLYTLFAYLCYQLLILEKSFLTNQPLVVGFCFLLIANISSIPFHFKFGETYHLEKSPLFTVMGLHSVHKDLNFIPQQNIFKPRYGIFKESAKRAVELSEIQQKIRLRSKKPNIIFIILESVASCQLIVDRKISPSLAPNLSKMSDHAIIFDSVYNTYPATADSHLAINTGGSIFTWGPHAALMTSSFQGNTLVGCLKKHHYQTMGITCGDLTAGNLIDFYYNLGFDVFVNYSDIDVQDQENFHAWGVGEEFAWKKTVHWLKKRNKDLPFFIQFLTITGHHPYQTPQNYSNPFGLNNTKNMYKNTIHYIDSVIGSMVEDLKKHQLHEDTIIVLTGDHGQAFAEHHRNNYLHRNHLYEENVRNFLFIYDPVNIKKPTVSQRILSAGDIAPTLLSLIQKDASIFQGQNALSENYKLRINYFHAHVTSQVGLRDGQWKFINNKYLFNLNDDPHEQNNLAYQYPQRMQEYNNLCNQWYLESTPKYTKNLAKLKLEIQNYKNISPGLKIVDSGYINDSNNFILQKVFHPFDRVFIRSTWVPCDRDQKIEFHLQSPFYEVSNFQSYISQQRALHFITATKDLPMVPGEWKIVVSNNETQREAFFHVSWDQDLNPASMKMYKDLAKKGNKSAMQILQKYGKN